MQRCWDAPRGYDAVYLNTIVSWYELPNPLPAGDSWLNRTIWWVHESAREAVRALTVASADCDVQRERLFH